MGMVFIWGQWNVLELDRNDGCTILWMHYIV